MRSKQLTVTTKWRTRESCVKILLRRQLSESVSTALAFRAALGTAMIDYI